MQHAEGSGDEAKDPTDANTVKKMVKRAKKT
jgi:hypothetical protein